MGEGEGLGQGVTGGEGGGRAGGREEKEVFWKTGQAWRD